MLMTPPAPTFGKEERMASRLLIETLFDNGGSRAAAAFPLRVVYRLVERKQGSAPAQLLVSVPKRRLKRAVDRNRVKRQIREAYRHHKQILWEQIPDGQQALVALIWLSDKHCPTNEVERRVAGLLQRIVNRC